MNGSSSNSGKVAATLSFFLVAPKTTNETQPASSSATEKLSEVYIWINSRPAALEAVVR